MSGGCGFSFPLEDPVKSIKTGICSQQKPRFFFFYKFCSQQNSGACCKYNFRSLFRCFRHFCEVCRRFLLFRDNFVPRSSTPRVALNQDRTFGIRRFRCRVTGACSIHPTKFRSPFPLAMPSVAHSRCAASRRSPDSFETGAVTRARKMQVPTRCALK